MVKVSVIVPVYNVEKYLSKCLDSIINQTLTDIEIIIINDGSTDKTQTIINKYLKKEKRIKFYKIVNAGLGNARNQGIKHAIGKYISFIDGDDYVDLNMLEKLYNRAVTDNSDIVECDFYWVYDNKKKLDNANYYSDNNNFMTNFRVMVCNKLFNRDLIIKNNISFPVGLKYEDVAFTYNILPYAKKISYVPLGMYYYVQHENSLINHQTYRVKDIFSVIDNIINFYKQNKLFKKYYEELEYFTIKILLGSSLYRILGVEDKKLRKTIIKENWLYLNDTFIKWRKNKYLRKIKRIRNIFYAYFTNYFTYMLAAGVYRLKSRLIK